ncbi:MAG: hypothetical protein CML78_05245 [Rhodobiaceae bacterium]|nr:hypothetical protein [Rhodobiaceae bacterium]RPF94241.1 MAG: hypothetical protein CBD22_005210 [Rhizobiales bacterium TMED162]
MSNFWKIWLDICCLAVIIFGGVLIGASIPGFQSRTKTFITLINPIDMPVFNEIERFAFGLIGAITMGWGVTFFYFFRAAHASNIGNKMYRQAFVVMIIWNLIDGYVSYRSGFALNIASNLLLSLGMVIPLYMSGKLRR